MKKLLALIIFSNFIASCQSYPPEGRVLYREGQSLTGTVSVIDNYPPENAVDIPVRSEIVIDFSAPIQRSSVNLNRFRVEDEFGILVPGRILFEENNQRLVFVPQSLGEPTVLEAASNYTVHMQYIRDASNRLVGSFSYKFRTQNQVPHSGSFRITEIYPKENLVFPTQPIAVQFSEEIDVPQNLQDECDCPSTACTPFWGDAFQILKLDIAEQSGVVPISGSVCREWNENTEKWDVLRFLPSSEADFLTGLDYFDIVVRASGGLKGADTGETLADGAYKQRRVWVIPIDYIWQILDFNDFL